MRSRYIIHNNNRRLILLFAGWGMDWRPLSTLTSDDYDILVVWDYRDLTFNWTPLMAYDEICLIAWSMGVFAASLTIHEIDSRITKRIAINGTLDPISDTRGIPTAIYHGTINSLAPATLRKFYRRMCTSRQQFENFSANMPRRTVAELIDELHAIETHTIFHTPQVTSWDMAVVSRDDAIFPAGNQCTAWRGIAPVMMNSGGHLPDFTSIINNYIIDKGRVTRSFTSGAESYENASTVQQEIARVLYSLFKRIHGSEDDTSGPGGAHINGDILEIGSGNGTLTRLYAKDRGQGSLTLWDLVDRKPICCPDDAHFIACDAEIAIRRTPSRSLKYIFSASTIQWFNSPASFLRECERVLMPDGYMVLSGFCANNISEFTQAAGVGLSLPSVKQWQSMISSAMTLYVCQASTLTLTFDSPRDILRHMRDTGVNALATGARSVSLARRVLSSYPIGDDGRYHLTYRPIFIIARRNEPTTG